MTWVAVAIAGGAVVGGLISAQGSKSAAQTQANAAMNAAGITQNQYQNTVGLEQPYTTSGYGAQAQLNYLLGIGQDPATAPPQLSYDDWLKKYGNAAIPMSDGTTSGGGKDSQIVKDTKIALGAGDPILSSVLGFGLFGHHSSKPAGPTPTMTQDQANKAAYDKYVAGNPNVPKTTTSSAGGYGSLLKPFTIDDFHKYSPAYQFQLQQGQQGVLNADSGNAGALSGAAQKDLIGYNQSMADTAFNNAFNQYQTQQGNIYSRLANVANLGQNAASNTGQIGANLAGSSAQSVSNAGSAIAAGQIGAANAYSNAIGTASALPWLMARPSTATTAPQAVSTGGNYNYGSAFSNS